MAGKRHSSWGIGSWAKGDDWRAHAACRGADPEMWTVVGTKLTAANQVAVRACGACPVAEQCDEWARESAPNGVILAGVAWVDGRPMGQVGRRRREAVAA